jgi:hypothetical protein
MGEIEAQVRLPASVQEIAEVIGRDKALYLIGQLPQCGKRSWRVVLYVPKRIDASHQLVRWLGWKDANRLVAEFGGEILQPSNCKHLHLALRNRVIVQMASEGLAPAVIAEAMQITSRQVRNILAEKPPEEMAAP